VNTAHRRSDQEKPGRAVSNIVLHERLTVPAPPMRVQQDWHYEVTHQLQLQAGDVEALPLGRARARWSDLRHCVQAALDWTKRLHLDKLLEHSEMALMACRGASLHHDGEQYGSYAFCNLFLSEDRGLDLHFATTGQRIALQRGTVVIFDTCQPHEVIARGSDHFSVSDFPDALDLTQVFLTWELPIDNPRLAQLLQVQFEPPSKSSD